jgi:hypothetical protein
MANPCKLTLFSLPYGCVRRVPQPFSLSYVLSSWNLNVFNMPPKLSTVKTVSAPRQRKPLARKPPPIPSQQRKEKLAACQENQRLIDDVVSEWYTYTLAKADDLGKRFNKKPRYFLNIFFQGGAKMVNHQEKTNAYNAFKSLKAADLNKGLYLFNHFTRLTDTVLQKETQRMS